VLAVGEHLLGHVDEVMLRVSTALAGGVGGSHQELCGALSGGALLIGALYGRTDPDLDDTECRRLVCCYRDRFIEELGTSNCFELRESGYGSEGKWPCSTLVERAARVLLEVLADEAAR
jgi:C_GCAxxG_C_C family probable redox protein